LLGERDPEITFEHVAEVDEVLGNDGFIQAVLFFEIFANFGTDLFFTAQRITRHRMHRHKGGGGDKPHRHHP
jgi:hypothetical protein